jgi:hypothetical protein
MDFSKIYKSHIDKAINRLRAGEVPPGFLPSTDYDVVVGDERFPPKQVLALAHYEATGATPAPSKFKGGKDGRAFNKLEEHGFIIQPKEKTISEECLAVFAYFAVATNRIKESEVIKEFVFKTHRKSDKWWSAKIDNIQASFWFEKLAGSEIYGQKLPEEIKKGLPSGENVQERIRQYALNYFLNDKRKCELLAKKYLVQPLSTDVDSALFDLLEIRGSGLSPGVRPIDTQNLPASDREALELARKKSGPEGARKLYIHYKRERDTGLGKAAKKIFSAIHGKLHCEACGFESELVFGFEIIEAHHKIPLSQSVEGRETTAEDFILLCPSCHRAIHKIPECNFTELQRLVSLANKPNKP